MKRIKLFFVFLLCWVFITTAGFSQVGINTLNPQGSFHVNAEGDFIITEDGKVGIGTGAPQNDVEIFSSETDNSNLRFSRLNLNTPAQAGAVAVLGVNTDGDVVTIDITSNGNLACVPSVLLARGNANEQDIFPQDADYVLSKDLKEVHIIGTENNISYNPETGTYTLQPGHTYKLEAAAAILATGNNFLYLQFKNLTTNSILGNTARSTPTTAGGDSVDGDQGKATGIIVVSEDPVEIALISVEDGSRVGKYSPLNSFVSIQQLDSCSRN